VFAKWNSIRTSLPLDHFLKVTFDEVSNLELRVIHDSLPEATCRQKLRNSVFGDESQRKKKRSGKSRSV
jgi:hypothetical protein